MKKPLFFDPGFVHYLEQRAQKQASAYLKSRDPAVGEDLMMVHFALECAKSESTIDQNPTATVSLSAGW